MWPMLEAVLDQVLRTVGTGLARLRSGCDVLLAVPETRPGFPDAEAQWLCQATRAHLGARGVASRVALAGRGHAGALAAIHQATQRVAQRRTQPEDPVFLVLGVESHHHPTTLFWLETEQRLALEGIPNGFTPGEAAAGVVLTTKGVRSAWGMPCAWTPLSLSGLPVALIVTQNFLLKRSLLRQRDEG